VYLNNVLELSLMQIDEAVCCVRFSRRQNAVVWTSGKVGIIFRMADRNWMSSD
jgi:hypothetical protein